ncbi:MAG: beta-class carbonic anhydrase [Fusobacteriaceae bacterium]
MNSDVRGNLDAILADNKKFVEDKEYLKYHTTKAPDKKISVVACMDTRLTELLPRALNIKNGDAKLIKNAGGVVVHPFGSAMRSIIIGIYELGVEEVYVIPHYDCGICNLDAGNIIDKMVERGINEDLVKNLFNSGIDIKKWLHGFDDVEESLRTSIATIKNHPLMPKTIPVHGLIIDPETGKLDLIVNGWENLEK